MLRTTLTQNQAYWIPKIERNMQRDRLVDYTLREQGWLEIKHGISPIVKIFRLHRSRKPPSRDHVRERTYVKN